MAVCVSRNSSERVQLMATLVRAAGGAHRAALAGLQYQRPGGGEGGAHCHAARAAFKIFIFIRRIAGSGACNGAAGACQRRLIRIRAGVVARVLTRLVQHIIWRIVRFPQRRAGTGTAGRREDISGECGLGADGGGCLPVHSLSLGSFFLD